MNGVLPTGWLIVACSLVLTACVGVPKSDFQDFMGEEITALGLISVKTTGRYSRGYDTQLRFFHLLNLNTRERFRVDVQSSATAFGLALEPGDYKLIRVQINEGPMMMESHVGFQFQVQPNTMTYLGNWEFDVDTPRTQRMLRLNISQESPDWEEMTLALQSQNQETLVVSLPEPRRDEVRLYIVAPMPKISYYYR